MNRDTRILASCLAAIALTILGSASAATIAMAHGAPRMLGLVFRLICHGIPHRCLMISGVAMPLCARCVGIYGGFLVGIAMFAIVMKAADSRQQTAGYRVPHPLLLSAVSYLLPVAVAPLAIDGFTQLLGLRESTNPLRLATGLVAGAAFGLWVLVNVETRARQRFAPS